MLKKQKKQICFKDFCVSRVASTVVLVSITFGILGLHSVDSHYKNEVLNKLQLIEQTNIALAATSTELDKKSITKFEKASVKNEVLEEMKEKTEEKDSLDKKLDELRKTKEDLFEKSQELELASHEKEKQRAKEREAEKLRIETEKRNRTIQVASRGMTTNRGIITKQSSNNVAIVDWNNLTRPTSLSAADIDRGLKGTGMAGLGSGFKEAERIYGVNAVFLASLGLHESGNGNSKIARDKNNLFGYRAYDRDPYNSAKHFSTMEEGIIFVGGKIKQNYLSKGGSYHNGYSIESMNIKYASDKGWASKIRNRGNIFR